MTDKPMTDAELEELERLHAAATPGPYVLDRPVWDESFCHVGTVVAVSYPGHLGSLNMDRAILIGRALDDQMPLDYKTQLANAECIVSAFNALPRLVAEVRRLRAVVERLRIAVKALNTAHEIYATTTFDPVQPALIRREVELRTAVGKCERDVIAAARQIAEAARAGEEAPDA